MRTLCLAALLLLTLPALAQAPRFGADIRFATLDGSGGLEGRAFLPIAPSDVRIEDASASCPGRTLGFRARGLRGYVRDLRVTLPLVSSPGTLSIGSGCGEVTVRAKLEDGSEVEGTGTLEVTRVHGSGPIALEATLDWSARVGRRPLPFHATLVVPAPPSP